MRSTVRRLLFTALLSCSLLLVACSDSDDGAAANLEDAPIVLVHGAWQDGSTWSAVQQELEADGRSVSAVTLPGRDGDAAGSQSLAGYRDAVITEVESYDEPVILVGHSFGGITISAVAEAVPDRVASLVYVAAFLPQDGDSLSSLAENDHISVLAEDGNLNFSEDFSLATIPEDRFADIFCPDCQGGDREAVTASAISEPAAPLAEPVSLTADNFGSVAKTYVLTSQDIVVGTQLQVSMAADSAVDELLVLNTGHAPYVTASVELADLIDRLR